MKRFILGISIILILATQGCSPVAPAPTATAISPSSTATLSPTPTHTPTPQANSTPTLTLTPTPGPDINLLYFSGGEIRHFHMQDWSEEIIPVQSNGEIQYAAFNPDQTWLAFQDGEGKKLVENPFTGQPIIFSKTINDQVKNPGFLFNPDNSLLAYTDDTGLRIYNILEKNAPLLVRHNFDLERVTNFRVYSAEQWSPNGQWLWIDVGGYEARYFALAHIPSGTIHDFSGCYTNIDWLENSQGFFATVWYSGYLGCGWEDGIHFIALNDDHSLNDQLIHQEKDAIIQPGREPWDLQISPDQTQISFVQAYQYENPPVFNLILISIDGSERKLLLSSDKEIATPIWSSDGKSIFYVLHTEDDSTIQQVNISSGQIETVCELPYWVKLARRFDGSNWLIADYESDRYRAYGKTSIYLINGDDGNGIRLPDNVNIHNIPPTPTNTPRPREPKIPE
jgi:hypothetical protein